MICDGRSVKRPDFPDLFNAIGTTWGGDGAPSFFLPDLRGRFLRGVDGDGRNPSNPPRDPDRDVRMSPLPPGSPNPGNSGNAVGSIQGDATQDHTHVEGGHSHAFPEELWSQPRNEVGGEQYGQFNQANPRWPSHRRHPGTVAATVVLGGPVAHGAGAPRTSAETRPQNAYVYWIIRVR